MKRIVKKIFSKCIIDIKIKAMEIIRILFILFFGYLSFKMCWSLKTLFSQIQECFDKGELNDFHQSIIETAIGAILSFIIFILSTLFEAHTIISRYKSKTDNAMRDALHSQNLKSFGYVSFNNESIIENSLPKDCNKSNCFIVQIISNEQLFPADYKIKKIKVYAYDNLNKPIKGAQCYFDNNQIVIFFNENSISDKALLYKFIVDTFYLNQHDSIAPVIYLKLKISYFFKKFSQVYDCKFSIQPTSGININGRFELKKLDKIENNLIGE